MNALLILLATATMGIDVGGQRLDDGGYEYIIQIEPQLLNNLLKGKDLVSEVPPGMDVRKYRITVGTGELPQDFGVTAADEKSAEPEAESSEDASPAAEEAETSGSASETPDGAVQEETAFRGPDSSKRRPALLQNETGSALTFDNDTSNGPLLKKPLIDHSGVRTAASTARDTYDDVDEEPTKAGSKKTGSRASDRGASTKSRFAADANDERPWGALVVTVIALFLSLGTNVYLGWTAWAARMRYADLLDQYHVERDKVSV